MQSGHWWCRARIRLDVLGAWQTSPKMWLSYLDLVNLSTYRRSCSSFDSRIFLVSCPTLCLLNLWNLVIVHKAVAAHHWIPKYIDPQHVGSIHEVDSPYSWVRSMEQNSGTLASHQNSSWRSWMFIPPNKVSVRGLEACAYEAIRSQHSCASAFRRSQHTWAFLDEDLQASPTSSWNVSTFHEICKYPNSNPCFSDLSSADSFTWVCPI